MKFFLWIFVFTLITVSAKEGIDAKTYISSIHSQEIGSKELYELIKKDDDDLYIVDIREPDQVGHGEIFHLNLVTITRGYLEFKIEKEIPNKNAQVIVYCCTGKRGNLAANTLNKMGYTNVRSLKGGIVEWVSEGYPLDTVYGEVFLKDVKVPKS
jgi:rhodanese-related sulfurtransferase